MSKGPVAIASERHVCAASVRACIEFRRQVLVEADPDSSARGLNPVGTSPASLHTLGRRMGRRCSRAFPNCGRHARGGVRQTAT